MERPFPRTPHRARRRTALVLVVIGALLAALVGTTLSTAQADDLKNKQHAVKKKIKGATADLEESSAALNAATKRLRSAQVQLGAAQKRLRNTRIALDRAKATDLRIKHKLINARAALARAHEDLRQGRLAVREQRDDIGRMAAENYVYGDPKLMGLVVVMNSQDPAEMTTQMNTVDSLMSKESTTLDSLQAAKDRLAATEVRVEKAKDEVARQKLASRKVVLRKRSLAVAAATARTRVARLVKHRHTLEVRAARARAADQRQLRQLRSEEARIKKAILERAKHQHGGYSGHTGGFLYRPVPGWVTSPFGWRRHPIYGYWGLHNGTDFHAPCGTPEKAGASGTVVDTYYSSVWGNRLFLDVGKVNGKNMTLVYNHISSYRVREGAHVGRGAILAWAGTTGWSTGCHLHFTVLLNGEPVNPMNYM